MVKQYTALGNKKALEELKKYPILKCDTCVAEFYKSSVRDKYMHELGIGTMRNMKSVFWGVFIPVWTCKAYTIRENKHLDFVMPISAIIAGKIIFRTKK